MSKIKLGNRPRYKRLNRRSNKKRENHKFSSANSASAITQGRYTDGVDEILCTVLSAKRRKSKIK